MKNKYTKRRYKLYSGVQQIQMDTPDYSKAYELQATEGAKTQGIKNAASQFSGAYAPIGQLGGMASDVIKSNNKGKGGAQLGGAVSMGASGAALGMQLGGPWGAAIGAVGGGIYGAVTGGKEYEKGKKLQKEAEHKTAMENANKGFATSATTDAQSALAKKGKYKLKTGTSTFKQPREIETEGREPIFSPKKADGTRDLLYYNPNDPTHEEGGVKAVVMPKNKYNNGTNNLMPKRPASKYSLVGNGMMAVGAKQLKVNNLNNTAFTENLTGMPAVNAANKFIQPTAGIQQVARNIPEARRKEKKNTPRSHKTANPDTNRIIDPPMLYEMKPPAPRSTFNTKNDFKNGGKYVKVYQAGAKDIDTYKHTKTFKSKPAYQAALQAHDDSLNLYGQSKYFTDVVKRSGLYNSTVEHPEVKPITRTGKGKAPSPLKAYGAPNDASEDIITVAGNNPIRKDLYSRKESQYKSFKEYEAAKASGQDHGTHEGYEINMYKHPEMALEYEPDSVKSLQGKKIKLQTSRDTIPNRAPIKPVIVPKVPDVKVPTKPIVTDTTTAATPKTPARNKFLGKEKTGFQKFTDKASNLIGRVGSSTRKSNGKAVRVFK